MKTRYASMPALRLALAVLPDTKVLVEDGDTGPQYSGMPNEEAVLHVGIHWVKLHYPEAFIEITKDRLLGKQ